MAEKIISDADAMSLAISEARKGHGFVSPNPVVGCVILDAAGHLLSTGYHKKVGGPHAEVEALAKINDPKKLQGAHVFITLEPCSHHGRTPPCAEALAKLPLKQVTYGLVDPNPKVSGKGIAIIESAGIKCVKWSDSETLEELAEIFLYNQRAQKTFVGLKVATSLDGYMALSSGESKWITGEEARAFSHELRARYDAVLIGKQTFSQDDPSLNVRLPGYENHENAVVIIDPRGETLSKLASSNLAKVRSKIFVACFEGEGPHVLKVRKNSQGQMDLEHLLELLWQKDLRSVFVEGGARTFASFLTERKLQRLHLFMAPKLIGGAHGVSWTKFFGSDKMLEILELDQNKPQFFGQDMYLSLKQHKMSEKN